MRQGGERWFDLVSPTPQVTSYHLPINQLLYGVACLSILASSWLSEHLGSYQEACCSTQVHTRRPHSLQTLPSGTVQGCEAHTHLSSGTLSFLQSAHTRIYESPVTEKAHLPPQHAGALIAQPTGTCTPPHHRCLASSFTEVSCSCGQGQNGRELGATCYHLRACLAWRTSLLPDGWH